MKTVNYSMTSLMRVFKISTVLGAAILAAFALKAQNEIHVPPPAPLPGNSDGISHEAKAFMQDAAQANQTEIAMANIAETRGQNSAVRELAKMMLDDHQQNYNLLQGLAQNHRVVLNASLGLLNQHAVNRLQKADIANFDKDYAKAMLKDHVKCITRFDKAVAEIEEPDVKLYAQNTLPALRKHLKHAEDAARAVGVDESTISSIIKGLPSDESQRGVASNQN